MLYVKNVPGRERAIRLIGAAAMAACAYAFWGEVAAYVFAAGSAVAALTAVFGFCPACALAGRRLDRAAKAGM